MTAIICFELIPEALLIADLHIVILGIILGVFMMILCDIIVDNKFSKSRKTVDSITDHRIGFSIYQMEDFLNGDLDEMIDNLITADRAERLKG